MKLKPKEIQLPQSTLFRLCQTTWTRWSYFGKLCTKILKLPFRIVACASDWYRPTEKLKNSYIRKLTSPDESGFWICHIKYGSQRASQQCDLLTKYFIKIWTFWIWLLLCTRGDGKQRTHSHGTTTGLERRQHGYGRCSQLTKLQWLHSPCSQTLWSDE